MLVKSLSTSPGRGTNYVVSDHDDSTGEPTSVRVGTRLDRVAGILESMGLTIVRRAAYEDDLGDGTGALGWLWAQSEPRRFPDETFDVAVTYSASEGGWSLGTPAGNLHGLDDFEDARQVVQRLLTDQESSNAVGASARTVPEWMWLVLAGTGTSVIMPFVAAIVEKSAEDAYASLRSLLSRGKDKPQAVEPGGHRSIVDPDHDVRIIGPDPLPEDAVRKLARMGQHEIHGHVLVWDDEAEAWHRYRRQQ